jgi:hypothetical protein
MNTCRVVKFQSTVICLVVCSIVLLVSGCANFLQPEIGATARREARIELADDGRQDGLLSTKDVELAYSLSGSGNAFNLSGEIAFKQSLTYSFGVISRFVLRMSFLDDQNRVIETVDITPLYSYLGSVPDQLPIRAASTRPTGATGIAFNYYGVFKDNAQHRGGDQWEIFYFPFD